MKILSVRGENLASLHGPFEIDFESEPLARAGLFAITGPTGAGKSTLLDAICVALYGTTPRLEAVNGRGHDVGREDDENRLGSTDPATLLRKGTASGFAEVRFVGRDGGRYRASWSVRRARNQPSGKVQVPSVQLVNEESGLPHPGKNTEVRREVERVVGLSYDQFCRSVLLAQGEFSRFLLANEKERAELLERVTGTEIYREISVAAHERHAAAKAGLDEVKRDLDGLKILSAEERAALEAERESRRAALEEARAHLEEAVAAVAWHETLGRLASLEREASAMVAGAALAWEEAQPLRDALAGIDRAAPLRPFVSAADDAASAEAAQVAACSAAAEGAQAAALEYEEAARRAVVAKEHHDEASLRAVGSAPRLAEARRLDLALDAASKEVEKARAARVDAVAGLESKRAELHGLERDAAAVQAGVTEAEGWLAEHAALAPVASQWDRWRDQLLRLAEARANEAEAAAAASSIALEADGHRGRLTAAREAAIRAGEELALAEEEVRRANEALGAANRPALRELRERLSRTDAGVRDLAGIAGTVSRLRAEIEASREAAQAAAREASAFTEEAAKQEARRDLLQDQVEEAVRAGNEARAALDLEERRSLLRDGEPCPLCGSETHPWASGAIALAERVRERDERAAALRGDHAGAARAHAEASASAGAAGKREAEGLEAAAGRAAKLPDLHGGWTSALPALRLDLLALVEALRAPWLGAAEEADRIDAALLRLDDGAPIPAAADEALALLLRLLGGLRGTIADRQAAAEKLEGEAVAARSREAAIRSEKDAKAAEALEGERRLQELAAGEQRDRLRVEVAQGEAASHLRSLEPVLAGLASHRDPTIRETVHLLSRTPTSESSERGSPPAGAARLLPAEVSSATLQDLVDRLAAGVDEWRRHEQARAEGAERLGTLRPKADAARSLAAERQVQMTKAEDAAQEAERAAGALAAARAGLLDGRPADIVEGELREEQEAAARALDEARASQLRASTDLATAKALVQAGDTALTGARAERERRVAFLDRALAEAGLSLAQVQERLTRPQAEVDGWRARIAALEDDRRKAATLADERRRAREAHEASARPALDEAAARAEAEARKEPCQGAEDAYHDARNSIRADDEARERAKAILPDLEARTAESEKWAAMHGLIGSANGDRFQLFAQGITLRVLLAHANVHLEELAPRYRLEKVPGKNLHIQVVDRHMGDDVRAANSLSGGETFLVSLALALGLSGLSSRSRVESLFIDEGFGSLDPQTLDVALATLDALQATGRKVGVISHVQGMAERIGVQIQVRPQGSGRSAVAVEVR